MTQKSLTFDECKQLSSRIIAMNPNRRANMGQISSHLLDYYTELTKQPWLAQLVGQIRDLTAQQNQMMQEEMKAGETYQQLDRKISDLKKQLPFRSPHYFHFLEDHRAQKFIDPEAFTFQTTVDIDNPEEVEPAVKNALLLNGMFDEPTEKLFREKIFSAEDIELWKGKVLHIERSARNKAHIDIRIPVGMTIAEAQSAFCKLIHATEDPSCVTPERIIFITDAASQIYTADDWYKRLDKEAVAEYRETYRKRGLDIDGRPLDVDSARSGASQSQAFQNASSAPTVDFEPIESEEEKARRAANAVQYEQTYDGVPYGEIVKALVELMGGAPVHGNRNNFIYREACLLRYICNSEAAWIKQVIETFGEDEAKAIEDFIVWSVKYDLWCKMRFFGNQMQEAIDADSRSVCHTPGVSNLLLYVHDTFDKTEIQNICQVHGTKTKLAILLCNWKKRGFIMKNEDGTFTKTARFIAKYGHYGTPGVAA